jgi:hypothetical protein
LPPDATNAVIQSNSTCRACLTPATTARARNNSFFRWQGREIGGSKPPHALAGKWDVESRMFLAHAKFALSLPNAMLASDHASWRPSRF